MSIMVINAAQDNELRVALVDKNLYDLEVERPDEAPTKSNIHGDAVVTRVEKSLEAAFVDYGADRHGFLPLKEVSPNYFKSAGTNGDSGDHTNDQLKVGQRLIVQVDKEERGTKGAALTTYISLAGAYLVLMPNNPRVGGISRRIEGVERDSLKDIVSKITAPKGMGFIVRTAGLGKTLKELQWDLDVLVNHWRAIEQAASEHSASKQKKKPFLLHQDGNAVIRAIRDNLRPEVSEVVVDDAKTHEIVKRYIAQIKPDFDTAKITHYERAEPIFSHYGIEREIEKAHQREVSLPSGGVLVIDRAEALVAIDINSSKATKGSDIAQTALQTNLEAAEEIPRQLRLRDLGGLIVIDFIDMDNTQHQKAVENKLRDALAFDRARVQMGKISRFGLLEMSRQRLKAPLGSARSITCPRCDGQGIIPSIEVLSQTLVRLLQQEVLDANLMQIQLYVPPDVATHLLNEHRAAIAELEAAHGKLIAVVPNPNLQSPQYHIKIISHQQLDPGTTLPTTYSLIAPKNFKTPKRSKSESQQLPTTQQAAVKHFIQAENPKESGNLIKRIKNIFVPIQSKSDEKMETDSQEQNTNEQTSRQGTNTRRRGQRGGQTGKAKQAPKTDSRSTGNKRKPASPSKTPAQPSDQQPRKNTRSRNKDSAAKTEQQISLSSVATSDVTSNASTTHDGKESSKKPVGNRSSRRRRGGQRRASSTKKSAKITPTNVAGETSTSAPLHENDTNTVDSTVLPKATKHDASTSPESTTKQQAKRAVTLANGQQEVGAASSAEPPGKKTSPPENEPPASPDSTDR